MNIAATSWQNPFCWVDVSEILFLLRERSLMWASLLLKHMNYAVTTQGSHLVTIFPKALGALLGNTPSLLAPELPSKGWHVCQRPEMSKLRTVEGLDLSRGFSSPWNCKDAGSTTFNCYNVALSPNLSN